MNTVRIVTPGGREYIPGATEDPKTLLRMRQRALEKERQASLVQETEAELDTSDDEEQDCNTSTTSHSNCFSM